MRQSRFFLAAFLILALLPACASMNSTQKIPTPTALDRILQKGELDVGTAGSMPPFNMTTKDGKVIGFEMDMARMMAHAMGVKLNVKTMPFGELLPALHTGKVDMVLSSMTITGQRNLKAGFVGPYAISGKGLLTKEKNLAQIKNPAQINDPKAVLVVLKGSTSQKFVENLIPKAKLITVDQYGQAVEMVLQDKADALIADNAICQVSVARYPGQGLLALVSPLTYEPLGIALPPNDSQIVNWVQNFVRLLRGSGQLKTLHQHWSKDTTWLEQLP